MSRFVVAGTTGQSINVFLQDRTSGDGVITLTTDKVKVNYSIGSTGAATSVALVGENSTATWASGGWAEKSSTLMPGIYRFDVPDASIASTPDVTYYVVCSTAGQNFIPVAVRLQVVSASGGDMPVDVQKYKGQSQTSVDIGAMLTSVNAKVTSVDTNMATIVPQISSVNAKVTSIDTKVSSMNTQVTSILANVTSMNTFVTSMNTQVTSILSNVTSIDTKVSSMNTQVTSILANVTSIDANVHSVLTFATSIDSRLTSMDTMLTSVNSHVTSIDSATYRNAMADSFLNRDMSTGTDSGSSAFRTPRQALRFLRNKWAIVGSTLTVYAEDDVTASWTATLTTAAGADPISGSDPA